MALNEMDEIPPDIVVVPPFPPIFAFDIAVAEPPAPTPTEYVPCRVWLDNVLTCPPPPPPAAPAPPPPTSKISALTALGNVIVAEPTAVNVYTAYAPSWI